MWFESKTFRLVRSAYTTELLTCCKSSTLLFNSIYVLFIHRVHYNFINNFDTLSQCLDGDLPIPIQGIYIFGRKGVLLATWFVLKGVYFGNNFARWSLTFGWSNFNVALTSLLGT